MTETLNVSRSLHIPPEYVTQTGGLLAMRGAGKTNAGRVLAEEMFHAGLPFCAIDPVGSWYGLRAGRDGNSNGGLPIFIFGGSHGDVPLTANSGALVADVVVDQRLTCIIDLSGFEDDDDKQKFLLQFARRLYFKNKDPLHLFLEEADDYIPQDASKAQRPLINAWVNIVRRGRSRGLGCTLITQRSAAINKEVLTQVENLFTLRTTGPQDIKAIAAWVQYHELGDELLESLAGLEDGEAWVWSPHFLKETKKFRFRVSTTFDSGATPKNFKGKTARKVATLADVDVAKLKGRITETIEAIALEQPSVLRSQLAKLKVEVHNLTAELERERAKKSQKLPPPVKVDLKALLRTTEKLAKVNLAMDAAAEEVRKSVAHLSSVSAKLDTTPRATVNVDNILGMPKTKGGGVSLLIPPPADRPITKSYLDGPHTGKLGPTSRAQLKVLAQVYPRKVKASYVSIISGYSARSSGFVNGLSTLRTAGLIAGGNGELQATDLGLKVAGEVEPPKSGRELLSYWKGVLPPTPRELLQVLFDAFPNPVGKEYLSEHSGKSLTSSGFINGISTLRTLELLTGFKDEMKIAEAFHE